MVKQIKEQVMWALLKTSKNLSSRKTKDRLVVTLKLEMMNSKTNSLKNCCPISMALEKQSRRKWWKRRKSNRSLKKYKKRNQWLQPLDPKRMTNSLIIASILVAGNQSLNAAWSKKRPPSKQETNTFRFQCQKWLFCKAMPTWQHQLQSLRKEHRSLSADKKLRKRSLF